MRQSFGTANRRTSKTEISRKVTKGAKTNPLRPGVFARNFFQTSRNKTSFSIRIKQEKWGNKPLHAKHMILSLIINVHGYGISTEIVFEQAG